VNAWQTVALGEATTITGGGTPTRNNTDYYGGTIPWVTPKDMKSWEIHGAQVNITEAGLESSAARLIPSNSVLIVVRSGVLKHTIPVALNRVPVAINQDMKALRCSSALDPDFLARFIKAQSSEILQWVRATTADNFPIDMLKQLRVPVPPLAEQRRIADVLDRAEVLRAKRRVALAQLDTLTQSIFLDLFGDPATNPKGWPRFTLGDLIVAGPQNGLYKPSADYGSGTPILRIDAFYDGAVTKLGTLKRVRLSDKERDLYLLRRDDIVVNRVNSMEYLGKSALIPKLDEPTVFESNMMRFEVDGQRVEPRYVVEFLQSMFVKGQILTAAKHAVNQSSINQQDVQDFRINIPPIALQRDFARRVTAVEKLKAAHRASLVELNALFAMLQHRAFRGEL
jgi:type I restriction enzyme S subunit